jgi:hypothetical protein
MFYRLTQLKLQLSFCILVTALVGVSIWRGPSAGADLTSLDRSTFIASLAAISSILALFCSIAIAFVLFVSQANRSERITAYDNFKSRLLDTQRWLLAQPDSKDRHTCLSLIFELDKLDSTDLPTRDRGNEYRHYAAALKSGLDMPERVGLLQTSLIYFGYIETLLNRIGLLAIRQIIARNFIDTLTKGVVIICIDVAGLLTATMVYDDPTKKLLITLSTFCGVASILLFYEFCVNIYRYYNEELDFVEEPSDGK